MSSDNVVVRTSAELEIERDRLLLLLTLINSLPPREQVLDQLADVRFLLGEDE